MGALTDRDFRFQVRVWYLDTAKSVCNGCARGCNIEIHTNKHRTHHNQGKRVARIKPRFNADVNKWWICDAGRYGFRWLDDESRLAAPRVTVDGQPVETTWDDAVADLRGAAVPVPPRGDRRARLAADVQRGPLGAPAPPRRPRGGPP